MKKTISQLFDHKDLITDLIYLKLDVRLACVKHLDSVHSEPSSNSKKINDVKDKSNKGKF